MYGNECLNADGFFHVREFETGRHRFEVTRSGPPNNVVRFEYTVRSTESYNKLILNLESGEVETDITDLSNFQ